MKTLNMTHSDSMSPTNLGKSHAFMMDMARTAISVTYLETTALGAKKACSDIFRKLSKDSVIKCMITLAACRKLGKQTVLKYIAMGVDKGRK